MNSVMCVCVCAFTSGFTHSAAPRATCHPGADSAAPVAEPVSRHRAAVSVVSGQSQCCILGG